MRVAHGIGFAAVAAVLLAIAVPAFAYSSNVWLEGADGHANALRQAKSLKAPVLVYFRVDWCPYCRRFDELLEDPEMRSGLTGVIKVRLDPEKSAAAKQLFDEYGASGYPALFLVPAGGGAPRGISSAKSAKAFLEQLPSS